MKDLEFRLASQQIVTRFATLTLKSLLAFNGGAVVTLLANWGVLQNTVDIYGQQLLRYGAACFLAGASLSLTSMVSAYLYVGMSQEAGSHRNEIVSVHVVKFVSIVLGMASLATFLMGALMVAGSFLQAGNNGG